MLGKLFGRKQPDVNDLDRQTISQLRKAGADLQLPRDTILYLYFQTQDGANIAASQLRAQEFTADVKPAAAGNDPWIVIANRDLVVNEESVRAMRVIAEAAARAGGGDFDGWEAAALP